jgi:hypothetical protein
MGEVLMRRLGKTVSVGLVWLATGATLFAGVPFSTCRCLAGAAPPLSDQKPADAHRSCCGPGCCAASGAGSCCRGRGASRAAPRPCCAGRHTAGQLPSSDRAPALSSTCCVRTTHQPEASLSTAAEPTARTAFNTHLLTLAHAPAAVSPAATGAAVVGPSPGHSLSPPPDLLSLLQHLLI